MGLARADGFPRNFGAYLLLSSMGRGGMGEVFLAKKRAVKDIDRLCIVKTLRGDLAEHQEYVRRFLDEARIVVQLNHSNICQVYEAGKVGTDFFLAMEYIPGVNIKDLVGDHVQGGEIMSSGLALWIGEQICEALGYAHRFKSPITGEALRVIHRDVSPANVMVSFEGEVKLIDFGLAESALKTEQTETRLVMGKVAYMSPEQARGEEIDGTTDQFATAVVLYEMLTCDRFYGDFNTHQVWQVVGMGTHVPRRWNLIDDRIKPVLARAMHADRSKRFPTCEAFGAALDEARAHIDGRGSRNQLREVMNHLYGARAAAERDVIASFADLRAPEGADQFSLAPPSGTVEVTQPSDRVNAVSGSASASATENWRNSPSGAGQLGPQPGANRQMPGVAVGQAVGQAVASLPPDLTARSGPAPMTGLAPPSSGVGADDATLKRPAHVSGAPLQALSDPMLTSPSARAELPPNNSGRVLAAGVVAVVAVVVALFAVTSGDTTSAADAGIVAIAADAGARVEVPPVFVDAGALAVVVDAGAVEALDAGASVALVEPVRPRDRKRPHDKPLDKPEGKPIDKPVDKPVDTPVKPVDTPVKPVDPADPGAEALTARDLFDVVERCRGREQCAQNVLSLPGIYDDKKLEQAKLALRPCAKKCLKAGVPRR